MRMQIRSNRSSCFRRRRRRRCCYIESSVVIVLHGWLKMEAEPNGEPFCMGILRRRNKIGGRQRCTIRLTSSRNLICGKKMFVRLNVCECATVCLSVFAISHGIANKNFPMISNARARPRSKRRHTSKRDDDDAGDATQIDIDLSNRRRR